MFNTILYSIGLASCVGIIWLLWVSQAYHMPPYESTKYVCIGPYALVLHSTDTQFNQIELDNICHSKWHSQGIRVEDTK